VPEFVVERFDLGVGEQCLGWRGRGWGEVAHQRHCRELMIVVVFVFDVVVFVADPAASDCEVRGMDKLSIPGMQIEVHCAERSNLLVMEFKLPHAAATSFRSFIENASFGCINIPTLFDGDSRFLHRNTKHIPHQSLHTLNAILDSKVPRKLRRFILFLAAKNTS